MKTQQKNHNSSVKALWKTPLIIAFFQGIKFFIQKKDKNKQIMTKKDYIEALWFFPLAGLIIGELESLLIYHTFGSIIFWVILGLGAGGIASLTFALLHYFGFLSKTPK